MWHMMGSLSLRWSWRAIALVVCCAFALAAAMLCAACAGPTAEVPVRDTVNDYSWDELAAISAQIGAASDDASGMSIAQRYHLVNDDGKLDGSQFKVVELSNGAQAHVLVAGFRHDDLAAGGKAGITFVFAEAVALHPMNNNAGIDKRSEADEFDATGGWNASEMRAWLNGEFADSLPPDLQAVQASVVKTSCVVPRCEAGNVGEGGVATFSGEELLGRATDKLWLPAAVEVADATEGAIDTEGMTAWASVLQMEGSRYQLFADAEQGGTADASRVRILAGDGKPCRWWLRSVENYGFIDVREDGTLDRLEEELSAHPQGVVPCFAI